ncbi:MAG TPA: M14 family metallopeptidase, partial [Blastocatellia bacterium]|nr:M14 family metallopeptidase [Blastocatellia bacterium]
AQARLADPRSIKSKEERDRLIRETPAVIAITCSIHSTEVVAAQMSMELAYKLASDAGGANANILRNTVLVLIPSVNPDGIDIVGGWYKKTLGTKFEGTNPPELYHHYTGHDNNRDWFMLTQVETRIVSRLFWREWFPQVVYDVHQQGQYGSRMFVPPFFDPANPNIDPLLLRQVGVFGMKMAANLTAAGFRGIATNSTYDMWWHGGLRTAPYYHNAVGILSEAASADLATPIEIRREQLRSPARGLQDPLASAINFPAPWEGGTWAPRDILDMELITCRTVLEEASLHREEMVRNFVELGERAIRRGKAEAPFAYIIPSDQRDYPTAARMVEILIEQGVEVHRARASFTTGGKTFGRGSWVILMDQPYRANVKALFEAQAYPDRRLYPGGPAEPPYDVAGWTLPMQMGVDYTSADRSFDADLAPIESVEAVKSATRTAWENPSEAGPARPVQLSRYYLKASANNSYALVNDLFKSATPVVISRLKQAESVGGQTFAPGDFVIEYRADKNRRATAAELNRLQGLIVELANKYFFHEGEITPDTRRTAAKTAAPVANQTRLARPRLALYKSWLAAMDEGWTRWVLEQFGFDYTTITDKEVRAGNLNQAFDVVILPDQSMQQIVEGHRAGSYPEPYTGGITDAGVANLKSFVERGGVLVCLDSASELALKRFDLPIKNVLETIRRDQFYAPGSIFRARLDLSHPLSAGMPEEADLYFVSG